jgi:hypothetical protein
LKPTGSRAAEAVALLLAAGAAAATQIRSYDLGWHLRAGEWIVRNGTVPRADMLSFTSEGVSWIDHGWLWQVAAWLLHSMGGVGALSLLKILSAAAVTLAGYLILRRGGWGPHSTALLLVLVLAGVRFRIADRPETAALALLAIFLYIALTPRTRLLRRVLLTVLVCAVWANVHASVLLAPVLASVLAAGSLLAGLRARQRGLPDSRSLLRRSRIEAAVAVAAGAGALLNPYGPRLAGVPFLLGEALADPRLVNPEWLGPAPGTFPLFYATLMAALALAAVRIIRFADPSAWRAFLLAGITGALALSSARHIGLFFTALPFVAALLGRPGWWGRSAGPVSDGTAPPLRSLLRPNRAPAWGLAAAILFALFTDGHGAVPGFGIQEGRFPEREADYITENLAAPRRLYNDVAHGGYLAWRFFPEDRIFIDGRNEVHAGLLRDIAAALDDGRAWRSLLESHRVGAAILRYRDERIRVAGARPEETRTFAALHFPRTSWALVFWGDAAMVFVRRGSGHERLIARDEYRFVHPEDWESLLARCREGDLLLRDGILEELRRRREEGPPSVRAETLRRRFEALPEGDD